MATAITLKQAEEDRLQEIYNNYCDVTRCMKLENFIMLLLQKNIITNNNYLSEFADIFSEASSGQENLSA